LAIGINGIVLHKLNGLITPRPKIFNLVKMIILTNLFYASFIMPLTGIWNYKDRKFETVIYFSRSGVVQALKQNLYEQKIRVI